MATSAITLQNIKKIYATGVSALKGIYLDIPEGDCFALLGPNGAGKTTIIGIISGLVEKTEGEVHVFDLNIDEHPEEARACIGVVPQEFNFNIFENCIDIVVNQAGYYGIPRKKAFERTEWAFKELGLWEKRNVPSRTLSGGMKRRLLIARALVHDPKILILDEPTAGVDIELRRSMWEFIRSLINRGVTIILTTHYLEEAESLCKNVAIINKGEIVESGSMKSLLSRMKSEAFIIYTAKPLPEGVAKNLLPFDTVPVDSTTLEVNIREHESLHSFLRLLDLQEIEIVSMKNKTNRLEEIFVNLIAQNK
ncbi:MAG: ABC transporter ATP-binding protein [Candidatus Sungbacteria bacterium]|nr:ABC transporter ATP-binding protein [Candidatus Sungbacteria bacterium]